MTTEQIRPTLANDPSEVVISREVSPLIEQARSLLPMSEIETAESFICSPTFAIQNVEGEAVVNEYMRQTATWADTVSSFWTPRKSFWHAIHAACCSAEKETAPAIGRIRAACDAAMKNWLRRKAEEQKRKQLLLDQAAGEQRNNHLKAAKLAALFGDSEKAAQLQQSADTLRAPVIMPTPTKLDGTAIKDQWVAECTDPMALLKAVADGRIPLNHKIKVRGKGEVDTPLFTVNQTVLNFLASRVGDNLNWPGVKVEADMSFAARKL